MDNGRRDFLKFGVTTAVGAVLPAAAQAQPKTAGKMDGQSMGQAAAHGPIPNSASGALRLVTFATAAEPRPRIGIVKSSGRVTDLGRAAKVLGVHLAFDAGDMIALAAAGPDGLAEVRKVAAKAADDGPAVDAVRLLAPIPRPARNVYAVGWNYLDHFEEGEKVREKKSDYPEHPVFFTKGTHTVNGPYDPIPFDAQVSTMIDWEGELAVIIGKRGRNIPEAEAMNYVFGYSVINDTTARDVQQKRHGGQWFKGKSLDGHGPLGPWVVPAADVGYDNLHLITRVNGVVKQDANTRQMYFKVPRIIAELSLGLTLEPGDVIATGTPSGVGFARTPQEFLKPGDVMETEIVEIGVIRNVITAVA